MYDHTLKRFDRELMSLNDKVHSLFKVVRKNLKQSLEALQCGDMEMAERVILQDQAVNLLEVESDQLARNLIVHHQPAASDLRFVFAAIKIVTDLERAGDFAKSIARETISMQGKPLAMDSVPLVEMHAKVREQLKMVRQAYKRRDSKLALQVVDIDKTINEMHAENAHLLMDQMSKHTDQIQECMRLLSISRMLERVGDHATNVAEMVVYITLGHEVRHVDVNQLAIMLQGDDDDE